MCDNRSRNVRVTAENRVVLFMAHRACATTILSTEAALIENNEAYAKLTTANGGTFT